MCNPSGLSDAEIEKMVQEAEANKEADAKKKAVIEIRNQADALLHSTKKTLEETLKNENATKEDIEAKLKTLTEKSCVNTKWKFPSSA